MNVWMKCEGTLVGGGGASGNCCIQELLHHCMVFRAGLHYDGEGLRSVKNAWPIHGYMRQMVDVPEKN